MHALDGGEGLRGLGFPEALRWRNDALWFSDMFRSRVIRWFPGTQPEVVIDQDSGSPVMPGGLGWLPDGSLLVVDCLERRLLRFAPSDRRGTVHADLHELSEFTLNDMHVDRDGTAWVGTYGFDPERDPPRPAPLLTVRPDGSTATTDAKFAFANGCERRIDGDLVVAETFADRISRLDENGRSHMTAAFPPGSGPDGLSVGADGTIFVALAFSRTLAAVTPRGEVHEIWRIEDSESVQLAVYDVAAHPSGNAVFVAMASSNESFAMDHDTGRVQILVDEQRSTGSTRWRSLPEA